MLTAWDFTATPALVLFVCVSCFVVVWWSVSEERE
jgi:hypothetical protein